MSPPAPPPISSLQGTAHAGAAGPSLAGEISRTRPSPAPATAIPAGAHVDGATTVPGKRKRNRNRNRNWKRRRVLGDGSDCQIVGVRSVPQTERDAGAGRGEQSKSAEELKAAPAPHAPTASAASPSRVLAAPHASATPFSCIPAAQAQSSALPISGIPAVLHAATNSPSTHIAAAPLPRIPAAPNSAASQAVHDPPCPMPPPRQLPSFPPPRPKPRPFLLSPSYACPPRSMPPPPLRQRAPPTSPPCPMPPPTTSRLQGSSPSAPLPAVAAASQRLASPSPAEESECQNVGAVAPAGADRVQPREREEIKSAEELKDGAMAIEAHVKGVPPTDATVGRQEDTKSAEELKSELERVSKQMNDLKNECAELKRDMKNKDLEIEAKEAEIQNFKRAKVACSSKDISSTRMDIDQPFHNPTNEALHAEGSYWTSTSRDEKLNGVMKQLHSMETQQAPGNTQVILNQNNPGQVSADSAAQSGHAGDWKEEIYQMIRSLKDQHFAKLSELFNNISLKVQPVDSIIAHQMLSKRFSGMENFKQMLDRILQFLQTSKSTIEPSMRYKVLKYENQIINIFSSERNKPVQQRVQQQFLQVQMNPYKGTSTSGVQTDTKAALHYRDVAATNPIACRSRLRKRAECEELRQRVEALKSENSSLRVELERIKKEYDELVLKNKSLKVDKPTYSP